MRILLVDDDAYWSNQLIRALKWEDWEVLYVRSPLEAMKTIQDSGENIDVILLDIMMPADEAVPEAKKEKGHNSGLILLEKLQPLVSNKIPVILLTARQDVDSQDYRKKAMLYLRKSQPTGDTLKAIRSAKESFGRMATGSE